MHAAFPTNMFVGPANPFFVDTIRNLTGIKLITDISGGDANGVVWDPIVRRGVTLLVCSILINGKCRA